jgi:predicted RND superfamily exporter protein
MLVVFFRSLTLAAAATVPTLLPVVATLGGMGWIGMSLDISRTMIAAIIVGIGVDHSIHLLHEYQLRTGRGESASDAMRGALIETGRPIVITTIALALGFLTLLASAWQTISSFGFLVAISMVGAMLSTIFVVPALIFWVSRLSGAARS